jgi:hypothetical protein
MFAFDTPSKSAKQFALFQSNRRAQPLTLYPLPGKLANRSPWRTRTMTFWSTYKPLPGIDVVPGFNNERHFLLAVLLTVLFYLVKQNLQ